MLTGQLVDCRLTD